jgi:hypothetical protein
MIDTSKPVRRIVTGRDAAGRSVFVSDGPTPAVREVTERPGYRVSNVWATLDTPVRIDQPDGSLEHKGLLPPKRGTLLRIIDIPPEPRDRAEFERMARATFGKLYGGDIHQDPKAGPHPLMHTTETVDYAVLLSGELYAVMDGGETLMRAGDVLIQRGTSHAWSNRSGKPCRILFVLIDGHDG